MELTSLLILHSTSIAPPQKYSNLHDKKEIISCLKQRKKETYISMETTYTQYLIKDLPP